MLVCILFVHALRHAHVNVDDQYMVYRYACNLAQGLGLTFSGERVEGFSCFSYVALLAGVFKCLGIHHPSSSNIAWLAVTSKAIGALCAIGTLAHLLALARSVFRCTPVACLLGLLPLLLSLDFVYSSTNGLETGLVILLYAGMSTHLTLHVVDPRSRRASFAAVFGVLLVLTRVDGWLLALTLVASWFVVTSMHRRSGDGLPWRTLVHVAAPILTASAGYLLFRWVYFHDLLPNTYHVKFPHVAGTQLIDMRAVWQGQPNMVAAWTRIPRTLLWYVVPAVWGFVLLAVALVSGPRLHKVFASLPSHTDRAAIQIPLFAAFPLTLYVARVGGDWMPGHRFLAHFFVPVMAAAGCAAAKHIVDTYHQSRARAVVAGIAFALLCAANLFTSEWSRDRAIYRALTDIAHDEKTTGSHAFLLLRGAKPWSSYFTMYADFMRHLAESIGPGDTVALYESGYASLALPARVIDLSGLNDRRIARPAPGEIFTSEGLGRVYITCGDDGGEKGAYVLSQNPRAIVFDTFQLRWCRRLPTTVFAGRYRLSSDAANNRLGFFSVYLPVVD